MPGRRRSLKIALQGRATGRSGAIFIETGAATGIGDVVGPASATDNAVVRYDGTTGKLIQNSGVIIDDSDNVTGIVGLTATGTSTLTTIDVGGSAGVRLTASNGTLTMLGVGDGFDENLTFDFNTTNNAVVVGTTTNVTTLDLSAFTSSIILGGIVTLDAIKGGDSNLDITGLSSSAGGDVSLLGGPGSAGKGGDLNLQGGTSAADGNGGQSTLIGGTSLGAGRNGGAVLIQGGTPGSGATTGQIVFNGNSEDLRLDFTSNLATITTATAVAKILYTSINTEIRGSDTAPGTLTLTTADLDVQDGDELGRIDFQAPLESGGTDAILVAASIFAEADATFSSILNTTDLVFATANSEVATEKMRLTSDGRLGIGITPTPILHVYENTVNVSTNAGLTIEQDGTGDAVLQYLLTGAFRVVTGIDNTDNSFKMAENADLASGVFFDYDISTNIIEFPSGNVRFADQIGSVGDPDTFIDVSVDDAMTVDCGGLEMIALVQDTISTIKINGPKADIDFELSGVDSVLISTVGQTGNQFVHINPGFANCDFDIGGDTNNFQIFHTDATIDGWGFGNVVPSARSGNWTVSGDTADKTFLAGVATGSSSASVDLLGDVVATLIRELADKGYIGAVVAP